jgi:hypothetical protein
MHVNIFSNISFCTIAKDISFAKKTIIKKVSESLMYKSDVFDFRSFVNLDPAELYCEELGLNFK